MVLLKNHRSTFQAARTVGLSFRFTIATAAVVTLTTGLYWFKVDPRVANASMLYLLVVAITALTLGRSPAIWASILSFLVFDWFFVNPRHTFTVAEPGEWITLCVFLVTAMIIGQLMASLQASVATARQHQKETAALAEASWAVASQLDTSSALNEVLNQVSRVIDVEFMLIATVDDDQAIPDIVARYPKQLDIGHLSNQVLDQLANAKLMRAPVTVYSSVVQDTLILPIATQDALMGLVYLRFKSLSSLGTKQKHIIDSLINHSALVFQRDRWLRQAAAAAALTQADRLKTALLSMVSHDFRSPITSIKASVSTLSQDGRPLDGETVRGLYQAIEQEVDRLNRMVGNILDLSRLEANAWRLKLEPTPVSEVIGMALNTFDADKNRRITVKLDPNLPELNADCTQIVQVLKNLVENALKYSPLDSEIEIRTGAAEGYGVVEVLDRGRGLPKTDVAEIFKPFWRAPDLHESSTPGVGIGLAVCKGLVEAHGGRIEALPRDGGGSRFKIFLPLCDSSNLELKDHARTCN